MALGLLGAFALFALRFVLPRAIARMVIPLASGIAMQQIVERTQVAEFHEHLASGGLQHSNWRVAGVVVLVCAGLLAALFCFVAVAVGIL